MAKENVQIIKCGKGIELEVDFGRFSAEVIEYLCTIGARNVLRDVHAGVEDKAEAWERSNNKLNSLYAGETHRAPEPGRVRRLELNVAERDAKIAELEARLAALGDAAKAPSEAPKAVRRVK